MNDEARAAKNAYYRKYMKDYRAENADRINVRQRAWHKANPEKVKKYRDSYWEKKAAGAAADTQA